MFFLLLLINCKSKNLNHSEVQNLSNDSICWYQKDFEKDKTPGVSLDKWYNLNKQNPKQNEIIVAVLDTQLDINHEDLKNQIWDNKNEIPNNNIDDDKNGYVDDVNGWNFIGHKKKKTYNVWSNFEYVRILNTYNKNKDINNKSSSSIEKQLEKSNQKYSKDFKFYDNWRNSLVFLLNKFKKSKDTLKYFFPKEKYNVSQLDSLYKKYKINDKTYKEMRNDNDSDLGALIFYTKLCYSTGKYKYEDLLFDKIQMDSIIGKNLNLNFDDRSNLKDNVNQLKEFYGNNKIKSDTSKLTKLDNHSTEVSGVLAAENNNKKGTFGFSNAIKIMPISISCSGDEHDKDIANGIYYAVNNGAKVINMSFGKDFSLKQEWVTEALKYATQKEVLVIHCAGNDAKNIDEEWNYPSDYDYFEKLELTNNFINVGATTQTLNEKFVSKFSNYGKNNLDLFAPGSDIYTTFIDNSYKSDSGTSLAAPMVSGTAALIWLYYPKLTAKQVKDIILESGTS